MNEHYDVAVVGAGITGLAAAYGAKRAGANVIVLEASDKIGGVVSTQHVDGFLIEEGPNSLSASADVLSLLEEIGLHNDIIEPPAASHRRYILRDNNLHPLPLSPPAFARSKLISVGGKLRALGEPFASRASTASGDESLASLVRRRFGEEVLDYVVDPFISGVYAGSPERLSSRHALRGLSELERTYGSVLVGALRRARAERGKGSGRAHIISFKRGLAQLPMALAAALNGEVQVKSRVTNIKRTGEDWVVRYNEGQSACSVTASNVLVTVPAHALDAILFPSFPREELAVLASVPYVPVATVALGYRREQVKHPLDGFGLLIPSKERKRMLGTIFSSSMFPGRAPEGHVLLTSFVGGARTVGELASEGVLDAALQEVGSVLGASGVPTTTRVKVWPRGIPQFVPGHDAVIAAAAKVSKVAPGFFFEGSYRDGVALGECLMNGVVAGERAAARRQVGVVR